MICRLCMMASLPHDDDKCPNPKYVHAFTPTMLYGEILKLDKKMDQLIGMMEEALKPLRKVRK